MIGITETITGTGLHKATRLRGYPWSHSTIW